MCEFGGHIRKLCDNQKCDYCKNRSFASHPKAKYWSELNKLTPREVFKSTADVYKFKCDCKHTYEQSPNHISSHNRGCVYCVHQKLCDDLECEMCFNNSFESHPKAKYWSKENGCSPGEVLKGSDKKFKFNCETCKHTFEMQLNTLSRKKKDEYEDIWCSFCANKQLCGKDECLICKDKSFINSDKAKYWHPDNELQPIQVFKNSNKKYLFNCDKCNHKISKSPNDVSNKGSWCVYCSKQQLCENDDCKMCKNNSFASNSKHIYWHSDNELSPRQVFASTTKKFKFICNFCNNLYEASLSNVSKGHWCSCQINKTESKLFDWLNTNYKNVEKGKRFDWCKKQYTLPFDFCLEDLKLIIELDGIQHFEQVSNWKSPEETQEYDNYKMNVANENGYSIIRIFQEDVQKDKNDWNNNLKNAIKKYNNVTNIFIGDIYKK